MNSICYSTMKYSLTIISDKVSGDWSTDLRPSD